MPFLACHPQFQMYAQMYASPTLAADCKNRELPLFCRVHFTFVFIPSSCPLTVEYCACRKEPTLSSRVSYPHHWRTLALVPSSPLALVACSLCPPHPPYG